LGWLDVVDRKEGEDIYVLRGVMNFLGISGGGNVTIHLFKGNTF
jgi:hypothetical protein